MIVPAIQANGLTVRFAVPGDRRAELVAVDRVTLSVFDGETVSVIGESGSGKSTLARALVCLQRPSAGQVLHGAVDPYGLSRAALRRHRRDYQIIFQDPNSALNPRRTILQSIREPLDFFATMNRGEREAAALANLVRVGLSEDMADRHPTELSGGQKQRVTIARALTLRPRVLVCDEAIAALDVSIQADILNLLADIQREFGLSYLFITHNISVARHVSDRIAVMYLGQIIEMSTGEKLATDSLHPYTKALLTIEPSLSVRTRTSAVLKGEIPSPISPPSGCRFRTRCPFAAPRCISEEPPLRDFGTDQAVACHFAEELRGQPLPSFASSGKGRSAGNGVGGTLL